MKTFILLLLVAALIVTGVAATVLPSLTTLYHPSGSASTGISIGNSDLPLKIACADDPCGCAGPGC